MPSLKAFVPGRFRSKNKTTPSSTQAPQANDPGSGIGGAATQVTDRPQIAPRTDKYGLFPFHSEENVETGGETGAVTAVANTWPIDIVAVHGITGDAYKTWEHENGTLWLRDLLLPDFPGSRVFSYGYDADVFFSLGTGNLETFARTMLQSVKQSRAGLQNRPLIFICHSMGGLVVKKAIIYTILKQTIYHDIRSSCLGVIFLGTPHRGSLQTGWPLLVANIANVATIGTSRLVGKARTDLLETLQREAPILEELAREFADQPRDVKIASFVEEDITPPAKDRVSHR